MSNITAALEMEEAAFKEMKRKSSLMTSRNSSTKSSSSSQRSTKSRNDSTKAAAVAWKTPDLMNFEDSYSRSLNNKQQQQKLGEMNHQVTSASSSAISSQDILSLFDSTVSAPGRSYSQQMPLMQPHHPNMWSSTISPTMTSSTSYAYPPQAQMATPYYMGNVNAYSASNSHFQAAGNSLSTVPPNNSGGVGLLMQPQQSSNNNGNMKLPSQDSVAPGNSNNESTNQQSVFDDKWSEAFDKWFQGDNKSAVTSQQQQVDKSTPCWLEWDPLQEQPVKTPSILVKNKQQSMDNDVVDGMKDPFEIYEKSEGVISPDTETSEDINNDAQEMSPQAAGTQHRLQQLQCECFGSELESFLFSLEHLRRGFTHCDPMCNPGHVIAHMTTANHLESIGGVGDEDSEELVVRISVTAKEIPEPVTFECNANSTVHHIVSQALCIAMEDISMVSTQDFSFKVEGRQEYLLGDSRLSLYRYVQECCKFEEDVRLHLLHKSQIDTSLARTVQDDKQAATCIKSFFTELGRYKSITRHDMDQLNEELCTESQTLLDEIKRDPDGRSVNIQLERVVDKVKTICNTLGGIETAGVSQCIDGLRSSCLGTLINKVTQTEKLVHQLQKVVAKLTGLYCSVCAIDLIEDLSQENAAIKSENGGSKNLKFQNITSVTSAYSLSCVSLHRIPKQWSQTHCKFHISCSLWHGSQCLSSDVLSDESMIDSVAHFHRRVLWNRSRMLFDVKICHLPLETMLRIQIYVTDEKASHLMAWADVPLFDHNRLLKYEGELIGLWDASKFPRNNERCLPTSSDVSKVDNCVLLVNFQTSLGTVDYILRHQLPNVNDITSSSPPPGSKSEHETNDMSEVLAQLQKFGGSTVQLKKNERRHIWNGRHDFVRNDRLDGTSLPLFLHCCPSWSAALPHRQQAYHLLSAVSRRPQPEESLVLLTPNFADTMVRQVAVEWLNGASDSDIYTWLPQLVQALRWELWLDNDLAHFVLRRALGNVRIAHRLFWLLRENAEDPMFGRRYLMMRAALMSSVGESMKKELEQETQFVQNIHRVAEAVKEAKDKTPKLQEELNRMCSNPSQHASFRLPTNPSSNVNGVDIKNSSYFTSNAFPIKVCMKNTDTGNGDFNILYKIGDDLRQDALTMQLIRVIEHMWLAEGLNLRLVTYDCLPTGNNQGFIELVSDSSTLREIQSSYGLTGAFKDRPIAEWLGKYNPNGNSYEKAVENFTLSCAGYCVVTYVLGICDRHNDNIMLKKSGHLFHIDFGRFLGHAQMFGNIKRDRAPFVLTSDMAYVINGGDRPSSRFQDFVDLCCEAFNIIRKRSYVLINLLSLMLDCGIPQLTSTKDLQYVYDALKPNSTYDEATTMFTRLIESSLSSSFTRLNFFIHHLAQLRFTSGGENEEDRKNLSFSPTLHPYRVEDGKITNVNVVAFYKTYAPDKIYMFKLRVYREKLLADGKMVEHQTDVTRTFSEFEELHRKLSYIFPPGQLPSFPGAVVLGRSQIKQVAVRRQMKLDAYLKFIFTSSPDVALHDLVYTFFHPILRDEDNYKQSLPPSLSIESSARLLDDKILDSNGKIKISLQYKNNALYVMIMHCKNLAVSDGTYPDPYVKTYLLPDPQRLTKRKTKVARKTINPTYNQMLIYELTLEDVRNRQLLCGVWDCGKLRENHQLGRVMIDLSAIQAQEQTVTQWYPLKVGNNLTPALS